jgi:hypothetical protein
MIPFIRKIRKKMADDNKPMKYMRYAIGEIVLVVLGILIALSINNWNQRRSLKNVEKAILEGIHQDIMNDTIDINSNMRMYRYYLKLAPIILNDLTYKKEKSDDIVQGIYFLATNDVLLMLHTSKFEEAKQKGLSIISNSTLREKISRLYEFHYPLTIKSDNDYKGFDYVELLFPIMGNIFEVDSESVKQNKVIISDKNYNALLSDKNLQYKFYEAQIMVKYLLEFYDDLKYNALDVSNSIALELEKFN